MGVNIYPEIEHGKVYKVKTLCAYDKKGKMWKSYDRRTVRYVTRWRKDEDIFLMSPTTIPDIGFDPFCLLGVQKPWGRPKGKSPLFTDIEETKDLELSTELCADALRRVCFGPKDNNLYHRPLSEEGAVYRNRGFIVEYTTWVTGIGYYARKVCDGESKVHFFQSDWEVNKVCITVDENTCL